MTSIKYDVYVNGKLLDTFFDRSSSITCLLHWILAEQLDDLNKYYILKVKKIGNHYNVDECKYKLTMYKDGVTIAKEIDKDELTIYSPLDSEIIDSISNYHLLKSIGDKLLLSNKTNTSQVEQFSSSNVIQRQPYSKPVRNRTTSPVKQSQTTVEESSKKEEIDINYMNNLINEVASSKPIESKRLIEDVILFKDEKEKQDAIEKEID